MTKRRMISAEVFETDRFTKLSNASQTLYTHMILHADDDGIVDNVENLMRVYRIQSKSLYELAEKNYLISLDCGLWLIADWRRMNKVRADRYKPTVYKTEFEQLSIDEKARYFKG